MSSDLQESNEQLEQNDSEASQLNDPNQSPYEDQLSYKQQSVGFVDEGVVVPPEQLEQLRHLGMRPIAAETDPNAASSQKKPQKQLK